MKAGRQQDRWSRAIPYVLGWLPVAVLAFYVKRSLIVTQSVYDHVARALGKLNAGQLTAMQKLSIFRTDLLVNLIVIPAAIVLLARYLPRRMRAAVVSIVCTTMALGLYAQLKALLTIQRFSSFHLMETGVRWGLAHSESAHALVGAGGIVKLAAILGLSGAACWWAARRDRSARELSSSSATATAAVGIVLAATTATAYGAHIPSSQWDTSVIVLASTALWSQSEVDTSEFARLGMPDLIRRFHQLTRSPDRMRDTRFWAKAAGSDVIFFMLETAPAASLPLDGPLDDMPVIHALRDRAIVATRHYSTYPVTNRAVFSILSSWYPSPLQARYDQRLSGLRAPGLPRSLRPHGYAVATYGPFPQDWEGEEGMYRALDIGRDVAGGPTTRFWQRESWEERLEKDRRALSLLEADLADNIRRGQRFVSVFMPQVGHFPLPDDGHAQSSASDRARSVIAREDGWLGEIVDLLRRNGRLDKTIIVVTGDHGFRIRQEDPDLSGVHVDERTFHVPFLMFAPAACSQTEWIPWMTSHIDVAPSVLDLLGVDSDRDMEQGLPIWDRRIQERTTFFLGRDYIGADGYQTDGEFSMWSWIYDEAYTNRSGLHFGANDLVPRLAPQRDAILDRIKHLTALDEAWAEALPRADQ